MPASISANGCSLDYEVLRQQAKGEDLTNEEAVREVLYTGCLLEYLNGEPWFDIHPIVRPLIERSIL